MEMTEAQRERHEAQRTLGQFMTHAGICSCGTPEAFLRLLLTELDRYDEEGKARTAVNLEDAAALAFAVVLDAWDLTDHGTSITWSWLTRAGLRLRAALRRLDLGDAGRSSEDVDELLPSYQREVGNWWTREAQLNPRWREGARYVELGEWETD